MKGRENMKKIWYYERIQVKNINKREKFHNIIQGMNMHYIYMRNSEIWMVRHIFRERSSFKGFNELFILKERNFTMF